MIAQAEQVDTIIIDGDEYTVIVENGQIVGVKRFNQKYKMWITIEFSEESGNGIDDLIIKTLSEIYKERLS